METHAADTVFLADLDLGRAASAPSSRRWIDLRPILPANGGLTLARFEYPDMPSW
jgi:hypothetical protein